VVLVVDLDRAPGVLTTSNAAAIGRLDLLIGADDRKGDLAGDLLVLGERFLVIAVVDGRLEDLDAVVRDVVEDLSSVSSGLGPRRAYRERTRCLKALISSSVMVSAFAMTGMMLTLECRRRMNSMSTGLRAWPVGSIK
jgi:hypothetical protein